MSNQSFFPQPDQELRAWLADFVAALPGVMTSLSLPGTFDDALDAANMTYGTTLTDHVAAQANAHAKAAAKNTARHVAIAALRVVVASLRANVLFTDAMAAILHLPPKDLAHTHIVPGTEVPAIEAVPSAPQQHTVYVWDPNSPALGRRGKAGWAEAARIIYAIVDTGAAAPSIENMLQLASVTHPPYVWTIPGANVGKTIWYRAAWETHERHIGAWSDPAKATVTG